MKEKLSNKIYIFFVSLAITAIITLCYFLDDSLDWGVEKILSCVLFDIWAFSLIPSFRYAWLKIKDRDDAEKLAYSFRLGAKFTAGTALCVLIAPYYAVKYYLSK